MPTDSDLNDQKSDEQPRDDESVSGVLDTPKGGDRSVPSGSSESPEAPVSRPWTEGTEEEKRDGAKGDGETGEGGDGSPNEFVVNHQDRPDLNASSEEEKTS